uniref:Tpr-related protein family member, putative n=1 Tax=Theileria annulata TaxID=5874 RepID=A0A3B0MN50_THEAN
MVQSTIVPDGFKTKASTLKTTAETQSKSELGTTNLTDLKSGNIPETGLGAKARQLAQKAQALYGVANAIVEAATTDTALKPLKDTAGALKNAAGTSGGLTSLFKAANQLAKQAARNGGDATEQANEVIRAFETVEKLYDLLMAKAGEHGLTNHPNVINVVKAYYEVKNTYYQMIITYRIQKKAEAFHTAASKLQTDAKGAGPDKPKLKALHTAASLQIQQLVAAAEALKGEADKLNGANEATIVTNYLAVAGDYGKLEKIPAFTEAQGERQVQNVKEKFEALKKSYVNVLRLRVQVLATKAQALYDKADELSSDRELKTQATALANEAMGTSDGNQGLKEKATKLVEAINGTDAVDANEKADDVIEAFDTLATKYKELAKQDKYQQLLKSALNKIKQNPSTPLQGAEENVKNVDTAYNNLKEVYKSILNFTKINHYSKQMDSKAQSTTSPTTAQEFKDKLDAFGNVYNSIPGDIKSIFQSDFESIKNVVYGAQLEKIQL